MIALLLAGLTWQVAAAFRPIAWICNNLTSDDTFLALRVALGWAEHGFPTFDGLHRTNGFQALWVVICWLVALVVREPLALLRTCLIITALLNTTTGVIMYGLVGRWRGSAAALCTVAFWTMYCVSGRPAQIGLENALAATIAALVIVGVDRLRVQPTPVWRWLAVGASLGLLTWARLDCAIITLFTSVVLAVMAVRRRAWLGFASFSACLAVMAAALIVFNTWAGETPTPVSGMVKRHIALSYEPHWTPAVLGGAVFDSAQQLFKSAAAGAGVLRPHALSSVVRVVLALALIAVLVQKKLRVTRWVALWAAALFLHVLGIRMWLSGYYADTLWYYAPEHVSCCLWVGIGCGALLRRIRSTRVMLAAAVAPVFIRLVAATFSLTSTPSGETLSDNRLAAAEWLRANVAADETVAAWNAGELSYFSECRLINLDGLVNDRSYYERIRAGRTGQAYLDDEGVIWVVDYARNLDWLPRDRWSETARFGESPEISQLVLRRIREVD